MSFDSQNAQLWVNVLVEEAGRQNGPAWWSGDGGQPEAVLFQWAHSLLRCSRQRPREAIEMPLERCRAAGPQWMAGPSSVPCGLVRPNLGGLRGTVAILVPWSSGRNGRHGWGRTIRRELSDG